MSQEILYMKSKVNLDCKICDKCCKYRGDIKITPVNVVEISKLLGCSIEDFLYLYTDRVKGEEPEIVLKTIGRERCCIFNDEDDNRCQVQKFKPMQCVMFPLVPIDLTSFVQQFGLTSLALHLDKTQFRTPDFLRCHDLGT